MAENYAILPCNGLDKCAGCITREIAVMLTEKTDGKIICPVLYRVADARYKKVAEERPLLVIDGCPTRCATKLASEKGLKVAKKITVTEEARNRGVEICETLNPGDKEMELVQAVVDALLQASQNEKAADEIAGLPEQIEYEIYKKDKFVFRVPKEGFYFNENDCWAYVTGNTAIVGVADYVQHSLSDIMFVTLPAVGMEIEQFGELGTVESGKAVFEVVAPVSGKVIAVNEEVAASPELINQNPYERGWIAKIALADFDEDKELLLDFDGYMAVLKRKADDFHA